MDTLKIEQVAAEGADANVHALSVKMAVGSHEVSYLYGMRVYSDVPGQTYNFFHRWALWRKSDKVWPETSIDPVACAKRNVPICGANVKVFSAQGTPDGVGASQGPASNTVWFPIPIKFVRPPQFLYEMVSTYNDHKIGAWFYFKTVILSDKEIAKLMVKDHS